MMTSDDRLHQILLIRGLARETRHWGDFIGELQTAYASRGLALRVTTVDLPGCGRHSEMRAPVTVAANVDFARSKYADIMASEAQAGMPPPSHRRLVALSFGGMIAANWLERFPTDFHSAVLMNSSWQGLSPFYERLRYDSWWRLPGLLAEQDVRVREQRVLEWISNRPERRSAVLDQWAAIQLSRPVSPANAALQLLAAGRFKPPDKIKAPVLVLASRQDRFVNPRCSEVIARHLKAKLVTHPSAGHDLTLDAGPWVAEMIAEWNGSPPRAD